MKIYGYMVKKTKIENSLVSRSKEKSSYRLIKCSIRFKVNMAKKPNFAMSTGASHKIWPNIYSYKTYLHYFREDKDD